MAALVPSRPEPRCRVNRSRYALQHNPFYLLDADTSSTGPELRVRLDDAQFEAVHDEAILADSFSRLSSPRGRVEAELAWPFMLPHARVMELARLSAEARKRAVVGVTLDEAGPLGLANILVDAASADVPDRTLIRAIDDAWGRVVNLQVVSALAALHSRSGSPPPDIEIVSPAIEELLRDHVATVHEAMDRAGHAAEWMTDLAERAVENGRCGRFLSGLAERYDAACEPELQKIRGRIDDVATKVRASPDRADYHVAELPGLLGAWDELNQPIQLLEQLRGHEEGRSSELGYELRDLAIWLANEKRLYKAALTITDCLLKTFPELENLAAKLREDVRALRDLTEEADRYGPLLSLSQFLTATIADPTPLVADARRKGFAFANEGPAGEFAKALRAALAFTAGGEFAEAPWGVALKLMQHLTDDAGAPGAAAMLGDFLLGLRDMPPRTVRNAFVSERDRARRAARSAGQSTKPPRPSPAPVHEPDPPTEDAGAAPMGMAGAGQPSARGGFTGLRIFAVLAVVVALIVFGLEDDEQTTVQDGRPTASVARPPADATPRQPFIEKPPVGYGRTLNVSEIRWCLFESDRIEGARNAVDSFVQVEVDVFNRRIEDLNARCGRYQYNPSDMTEAQRDLAAHQDTLGREGADWVEAMRGRSQPSAPFGEALKDPELARRVQSRLKALGYYRHAIDGAFGRGSVAALRAFKRDHPRLPADDVWDPDTAAALFE